MVYNKQTNKQTTLLAHATCLVIGGQVDSAHQSLAEIWDDETSILLNFGGHGAGKEPSVSH